MAKWTDEAQTYLEGYLQQVAAMLLARGSDGGEVVEDLRSHILEQADASATVLMTVDEVRRMLTTLGTPEEVVLSWSQLGPAHEEADPWAAPHLNQGGGGSGSTRAGHWITPVAAIAVALLLVGGSWLLSKDRVVQAPSVEAPQTSAPAAPPRQEAPAPTREIPGRLVQGWIQAGSNLTDYVTGTAEGVEGMRAETMFIRSTAPSPSGFSTVMTTVRADAYRGGRATLTGMIRAEAVGGQADVWMRIDGPQGEVLGFRNTQDRPIAGAGGVQSYTIFLDVPTTAAEIAYGVMLTGQGKVWFNRPGLAPQG